VGGIGILGVDKKGEDWYQITIGGSDREDAALGKVLGKAVAADEVADTLKKILETYVELRTDEERFVDTVRRVGVTPFKEKVYATAH
jgi:sulfite reductase (NADPH) hemoprotein beta-component